MNNLKYKKGDKVLLQHGCVIELMVNYGGDWHVEKELLIAEPEEKEVMWYGVDDDRIDVGFMKMGGDVYCGAVDLKKNEGLVEKVDQDWVNFDKWMDKEFETITIE